jgi:two-component system response regulator TctD
LRILVIEDTADLAEAMVARLRRLGHAVDLATDGEEADQLLRQETYNLVVLDLLLPGLDGRAVLRRLRARDQALPVLVVTAISQVDQKVGLLDLGADDYIVKPFDFRELEARCRALLRRPLGMGAAEARYGNLCLDTAARRVTIDGLPVELTAREMRLLELLLGNQGRVMSKAALLDQLYGLDEAVAPNAVELYVSRLRRKLERATVEIRTVRGLGYVLEAHDAG